jgi:hypothetical protein
LGWAYIWVISNLLDHRVIKVTRVSQEVGTNLVGMFETFEDIGSDGELGTLSQLRSLSFAFGMNVLHPTVMVRGTLIGYMLLEDDDVGIRHLNGI